jgi:hypothetical protein
MSQRKRVVMDWEPERPGGQAARLSQCSRVHLNSLRNSESHRTYRRALRSIRNRRQLRPGGQVALVAVMPSDAPAPLNAST